MSKFKVKVIVTKTVEREYTIYSKREDDIRGIMEATNFDFLDYDDEQFVNERVDEVLDIKKLET